MTTVIEVKNVDGDDDADDIMSSTDEEGTL